MKKYVAALIKSPWARKYEWQVEKDINILSCEAYEVERVEAQNKQHAVKLLNLVYGGQYEIKSRPFNWGRGWW